MDSQIENVRPSGLKQPSTRLPALSNASRTFGETSQSDMNARNGLGTGIPQPASIVPSKHKPNGRKESTLRYSVLRTPTRPSLSNYSYAPVPEPIAKRKTLIERGGEVNKPSHSKSAHARSASTLAPSVSRLNSAPLGGSYRPTSAAAHAPFGGPRPLSRQHGGLRAPAGTDTGSNIEQEDDTNAPGKRKAWDTKGRLEDMERVFKQLSSQFETAHESKSATEQSLALFKSRVETLEMERGELRSDNKELKDDLDRARSDLHATATDLLRAKTDHQNAIQDVQRRHEKEIDDMNAFKDREMERLKLERERDTDRYTKELAQLKVDLAREKDTETAEMTTAHWEELDQLRHEHETELAKLREKQGQEMERLRDSHNQEVAKLQREISDLRRSGESRATESATEVQLLRESLDNLKAQLEAASITVGILRTDLTVEKSRCSALEQEKATWISKAHFLEGNQEAQSLEFTKLKQESQDAKAARDQALEQLRKEETVRRRLNATILELKGNIRVFARTRPLLDGESDPANVEYPDVKALDGGKQMIVHAPTTLSAAGKERNEKETYEFDRSFIPGASNEQVFDECRELIQSVIDGFNVSLLSYGQTGSGKTYGMSGPNGIIPSSIRMLLAELKRLQEKGWEYTVEASFVEVYNETLNDLLGDAKTWDEDQDNAASVRGKKKEKHEIHHDAITGKTTVTNLSSVSLWPPPEGEGLAEGDDADAPDSYTERAVTQLLETAAKNRRVAATKANERSSRSHSVFMLTLRGNCDVTNESSEGVLNLVDLAGSERLKQSGAEGNRMKETQAINKSLSSLGDVIAALGNKGGRSDAHIPYRNSKLTYLLQSSLGGTAANGKSSRTLMLLHLSPLQQHWQESKSSLLFGSKVHKTHIGTAKKR